MLGYLVCAGTYLFLLLASLTLWRRRVRTSYLPAAFGAQIAWSVILVIEGSGAGVSVAAVAAVECLRSFAWALILTRWLTACAATRLGHWVLGVVAVVGGFCCRGLLLPTGSERVMGFWVWAGLTLSATGLILVEQVARNTRAAHQWHFKYLWLAIGGLFTWDLIIYSSELLHGSIAATLLAARGFVNALIGVLFVVGVRRGPIGQVSTFISPRPVFFSATLLGALLYICGTAAASYFIREQGGSWGAVGQAVFLAGAVFVLLVTLMSEQFRAWTRVTLAKHFFPYRYDYRAEWQKLTRALSQSDGTPLYERIAAVIASSVNCGSGGLWLRDSEGVFVPVGGDLALAAPAVASENDEFFEYLRVKEWIFDLDAARAANPQDHTPRAPDWMLANTSIWLVVPLVCEETLVGFAALSQPLAQMRLTWEEIDLLRAAGRQVASFLAFEEAGRRLAEARQFEALNRVSAVLMHDLRHLIAQQALVVQNAARHRGNPAFFDDAIMTIDNSVKRMNRLMDELRTGVVMDQTQCIDVVAVCDEAVERCGSRVPAPVLTSRDRTIEIVANRDPMLHAIEHVIRNAQDATPPSGTVSVEVRRSGQRAVIEVKDTGTGMDPEFIRNRLFRPFDTTKAERGMGIGAYGVRKFVMQCGGNVEVDSAPGKGTKFTINLPLAPASATRSRTIRDELQTS